MPRGGSRPKRRRDDARGGVRPNSGPNIRRLQLSAEIAQKLKVLTLNRRGVTGDQELQPVDVVSDLIHAAWLEYDAAVNAIGEEAQEWL